MSSIVRWILVGSVSVIAVVALVILGVVIGMALWQPVSGWMSNASHILPVSGTVSGWMRSGQSMMGSGYISRADVRGSLAGNEFTIEAVEERLEEYLRDSEELEVGEIMIFDNHAYAQIMESATGIGAMEVLVDPQTLGIYPERGPNMMWNLKYSSMHGGGMMGSVSKWDGVGEMSVSSEEAVELAQAYLNRTSSGLNADEHADLFYGYYTIHILRDGEVVGMLSVHGNSGQVFPHTWHGALLVMSETNDH
jgi:hypothetical protein